MSMRRTALFLLLVGLLAGRATAAEHEQFLRFKSWQAFLDSGESLYTVRCVAPDLAKCVRDYEARGYVQLAVPRLAWAWVEVSRCLAPHPRYMTEEETNDEIDSVRIPSLAVALLMLALAPVTSRRFALSFSITGRVIWKI